MAFRLWKELTLTNRLLRLGNECNSSRTCFSGQITTEKEINVFPSSTELDNLKAKPLNQNPTGAPQLSVLKYFPDAHIPTAHCVSSPNLQVLILRGPEISFLQKPNYSGGETWREGEEERGRWPDSPPRLPHCGQTTRNRTKETKTQLIFWVHLCTKSPEGRSGNVLSGVWIWGGVSVLDWQSNMHCSFCILSYSIFRADNNDNMWQYT